MSDALNTFPDTSTPELSLGSLASFSTTRVKSTPRVPSASSGTTAASSAFVSTPTGSKSFSSLRLHARQHSSASLMDDVDDVDGDNLLDTPLEKKSKWSAGPGASKSKPTTSINGKGSAPLTLRDQEKHIDNLKKENFDIKLRVHFLEERLQSLAPDQIDAALKQNINLKIEVQSRGREIKRLKKIVLELEKELERGGVGRHRERELEEKLQEREHEIGELRRRKRSSGGGNGEQDALRRNAELEAELETTTSLLQDNMDEIDRLRDLLERQPSSNASGRIKEQIADLEADNEELRNRLEEREEERGELIDEIEGLRLEIEELQRRREAENQERSESRAQVLEEREEREAVEDDLNALRDRLTALQIELQQREQEVDMRDQDIEELRQEHIQIVNRVENEWRGEVEEAQGQVEELRDVLAEKEAESKELRLSISELEAESQDVHDRFEAALAHLEQDAEEKELRIEQLNDALEHMKDQIYVLEDENDKLREESDRIREDETAERERLEAVGAALKEKLAGIKAELEEMTDMYETCTEEVQAHRSKQEELAQHIEDLVNELQAERRDRQNLEDAIRKADKDHEAAIRQQKREVEAKESALQNASNDLARAQSLLSQREADLQAVETSLQSIEVESKKAGEHHSTAKFSLQLEVDRLKRDVERLESELSRARKDLDDKDLKGRDRDSALDKLHSENRDLATQLATQTQARLNISEKLDALQASFKANEADAASYKAKVADLESRLSKDQRSLHSAEAQYRDQLTERNTLLLTIYQYMDKILGVDKTPKKSGQAETKPFTNFSVFHDNLITRLKALSQIQLDFDKRAKEIEGRFMEKLADMRKQLDTRWKQVDKFEASVKVYADAKATWRRKLSSKEGELEAIKTTNAELAAQLSSSKPRGQADPMEVRSLSTRAVNAERRLNNAQNQLLATEEKISALNQRNAAADMKWEARVKEYESRLKLAEEKVKRERQGGKERAAELEANLKSLQRQLDMAQKRNQQLADVIDVNKVPAGSPAR